MRRKHCEINDRDEMIRILDACTIGRMATTGADGYPYITPVNYVFYDGSVYFHCSHKGEKLDNIARDPKVCFEVDQPLAYIELGFSEKESSCNMHQSYHCVVIRGTARVIPDGQLKADALNALVVKHEGHTDFPAITPETPDAKACALVEIKLESMTGKSDLSQNKKPEDRRKLAGFLTERGLPGDLETARAMGFEVGGNDESGWRIKD